MALEKEIILAQIEQDSERFRLLVNGDGSVTVQLEEREVKSLQGQIDEIFGEKLQEVTVDTQAVADMRDETLAARDLARNWATSELDVEVGLSSARTYALAANAAREAGEQAQQAAELAQGEAEGARDTSLGAAQASSEYRDAANQAAQIAIGAKEKAEQWAEAEVDVEVEPGKYSAKHWAAQAEASANPIPQGSIILWSGLLTNLPVGWALCNGQNGTPDLRDRFVVGAGSSYSVGATGGANSVTLTEAQMPTHNHSATTATAGGHSHSASTGSAGNHSHSGSASSGGSHSHGHRVNTSGNGSMSGQYLYGYGSWRTNSSPNVTFPGPDVVASAGEHTHSLSINGAGAHTHSVSVASGGEHTHGVSVGNTGGGGAHENRPPYYALAYIMKL